MSSVPRELFDALNDALEDAERLFRARMFRCRATLLLANGDELSFGKSDGGRWGFECAGRPMAAANLHQRILMAKALPELWAALLVVEDERYRDIDDTTRNLVAWLETLDATPRTEDGE